MEEKIRRAIQKAVSGGRRNYVIFPFGEQGRLFKRILNDEFGRQEALIIDSGKRDPESGVKRFEEVEPGFWEDCTLFIVSDHTEIYFELRSRALQYVPGKNVLDVLTNEWGTDDALQGILTRDRTRVFFNPVLRFHDENTVEALGNNTGNLVYVEALREQLDYHIEARLTREWVGDRLGRGSVVSVMPASNFVAEYAVWCESLLPILEQTDMRFTFVGLGAQAGFHETPRDVVAGLTEGQKRVFRAVGEHAAQIGVRGEFTAACMEEMGIGNVESSAAPPFTSTRGNTPYWQSRQRTGYSIRQTVPKRKYTHWPDSMIPAWYARTMRTVLGGQKRFSMILRSGMILSPVRDLRLPSEAGFTET